MDARTKTRENRLRQAAARQRMTLTRARRRDPRAWDYARYWLAPAAGGGAVVGAAGQRARVGDPPGLTLDEVEAYLTGRP